MKVILDGFLSNELRQDLSAIILFYLIYDIVDTQDSNLAKGRKIDFSSFALLRQIDKVIIVPFMLFEFKVKQKALGQFLRCHSETLKFSNFFASYTLIFSI